MSAQVAVRRPLAEMTELSSRIARAEAELGRSGRVLFMGLLGLGCSDATSVPVIQRDFVAFKAAECLANYRYACGIRTDDAVACWGDNSFGQLEVP